MLLITRVITDQIGLHSVPLPLLIVSITKFSIMIASPRAYLSRKSERDHMGVQLQVSNLNFFGNWIPVIGYPGDSHVNNARFNGFLRNVSFSFQNLRKGIFAQKKFSKDIFNSEICIDTIN